MPGLIEALRLRTLRRRLLWKALRSRPRPVIDRTGAIRPGAHLAFVCLRNEALRLPYFLDHHRRLGIDHFLIVDNASEDGSADYLAAQGDVSLFHAPGSYKAARFGMDWINALLMRHGHGHWCLTLDADELFTFPEAHLGLPALTRWLTAQKAPAMAALMLDLYPEGPLGALPYAPGQDPVEVLPFFDPTGYDRTHVPRYDHVSIRGGPRRRVFFAEAPERAPHLHKTPLVFWHWRYAWLSSTHLALPIRLNAGFQRPDLPTGALLHTKFLPEILAKSASEKMRAEHFTHPEHYGSYYDRLTEAPVLWHPGSARYEGPEQLERLGLMQRGLWAKRANL